LVRAKLTGTTAYVPFKLEHPNACDQSNLICPLVIGQTYQYIQSVPINEQYPKVKQE
jgi:hypothetical protein